MSSTTANRSSGSLSPMAKRGIAAAAILVLLIAMALDTTIVTKGSSIGAAEQGFSQERYGKTEFPKVQKTIEQKAASADQLIQAVNEDKSAAVKQYGVPGDIAPVMSVKFTGTVGDGSSGIYNVNVPGLPDDLTIRVQTGPAINGTVLRDGVGDIGFGDFKNQIEYQNAAAGLNNEMKQQVLSDIDRDNLSGKKVSVVGAFQLINPNNWLVTPVRLDVQ